MGELARSDAAVAGSKILIDGGTDRTAELESVGGATDVYGDVYTGLDPDELDLEQYDVVREVSYVLAVSLLVRRDLLRGLGGFDPRLGSAGIKHRFLSEGASGRWQGNRGSFL